MSVSQNVLAGAVLFSCSLALAADEELPDMEFLEYLGSWEGSEVEWEMFDKPNTADVDERKDHVPQGEESTETEDES